MFTRLRPVIAVCAVAVALCGCAASPEPADPSPVFTSEADAFAAAEETYRAYVDALNQVDLSDPETFEAVYAWTTGEANAGARKSFSQMHADGWQVTGPTTIDLAEPRAAPEDAPWLVELYVCQNVEQVSVTSATGESVVAPDRRNVHAMVLQLSASSASSTGLLIALISGREGSPSCAA